MTCDDCDFWIAKWEALLPAAIRISKLEKEVYELKAKLALEQKWAAQYRKAYLCK